MKGKQYKAGTKVLLNCSGSFTWKDSYKSVYGIVQQDGKIALFNKKDNAPASVYSEKPRAWTFYSHEIRKKHWWSR